MNNKVKFLRGTSNEYTVAEKDSDTIYFTTDDGKLYIGDKEVSGDGSITIDNTLSDTSTNPVQNKIVKQAIDNKADKSLYGDTTINVGRKAETDVGEHSTAEGYNTTASGGASHAEGLNTIASGVHSHAEGVETIASGSRSHAEGIWTIASGGSNHAEGKETTANGNNSCHAEGSKTTASGIATHAEGNSSNKVTDLITDFSWNGTTNDDIINAWNTQKFSVAHGRSSHVEGSDNLSLGHSSHAEGNKTIAVGVNSHTSGYYTKALHDNEAAYGKYNESNDNTLFSIGDGTADDARHNAFEITTDGGKLHDKDIATTDLIPTSLPANGGNADIAHKVISPSSKVSLYENEEGGNLELVAPDGVHLMQMDLYNNEYFRMYFYDGSQAYFPVDFNFSTGKFNINGDAGNADTLDGLHADDFAKSTSPRITGDMRFQSDSTQNTITAIYSANDVLVLRNATKDWSSICDVVIGNDGVRIANATQNFKVGDGGNADTVDGFHADDFYSPNTKPYVTGTATNVVDGVIHSNTYYSYHGFMPSAVFYIVPGQMTNQHDMIYSAKSFDTEKFTAPSMTDGAGNTLTQIKYIMFK